MALVVAVLGILGTSMNVMQLDEPFAGDAERPAAVITSTLTFIPLIIYVIVGVPTMVLARRRDSMERPVH
ncbi:hypothetical protein GCM10009720_03870 [Yaniella flava]|uniref:Uncharacterized protein n=1 Tax=Yaniella flava TaxID=287930 RepID=A0ABN2U3Y1_9MICC